MRVFLRIISLLFVSFFLSILVPYTLGFSFTRLYQYHRFNQHMNHLQSLSMSIYKKKDGGESNDRDMLEATKSLLKSQQKRADKIERKAVLKQEALGNNPVQHLFCRDNHVSYSAFLNSCFYFPSQVFCRWQCKFRTEEFRRTEYYQL